MGKVTTANTKIIRLQQKLFYIYCNLALIKEKLLRQFDNSFYSLDSLDILRDTLLDLLKSIDSKLKWSYYFDLQELIESKSTNKLINEKIRNIEIIFSNIFRILTRITELLSFIDSAQDSENPWRLYGSMVRLSNDLIPNSKIVIRSQWQFNYNYMSISCEINELINSLHYIDKVLANSRYAEFIKKPFLYSLSYPPENGKDILNMAIWSHELGHCIDNYYGYLINNNYNDFYSKHLIQNIFQNILRSKENEKELEKICNTYMSDATQEDREEVKNTIYGLLLRKFMNWSKEIFADLLSTYLFGYSSLFSFIHLTKSLETSNKLIKPDNQYPPSSLRIRTMLFSLDRSNSTYLEIIPSPHKKLLIDEIQYARTLSKENVDDFVENNIDVAIGNFVKNIIIKNFPTVISYFCDEIEKLPFYKNNPIKIEKVTLGSLYKNSLKNLGNDSPIDFKKYNLQKSLTILQKFTVIFNSGWLFWMFRRGENKFTHVKDYDEILEEYFKINRIIEKSFEILEAENWYEDRKFVIEHNNQENIFGKKTHYKQSQPEINGYKGVRIFPLLDKYRQIDDCSIDLRLGNEFIETLLPYITKIDPAELNNQTRLEEYQSKLYLPFGKAYVLHPNKFVLGSTLEYLMFPKDKFGLVIGRSSWGRLGLIIATASKVDPLFKGCITLEITNLGNVPIFLYPGSRIGQLTIHKVTK